MENNLEDKLASASKLETDEDCDLFFDTLQKNGFIKR